MMKPAIVVIAYNRHDCLRRILSSLSSAKYPTEDIRLVISIDRGDNPKVLATAESFHWNHGDKEVIAHTKKMGLRRHVLSCGDLTERFGSVILLEDDLYVSPMFYSYASECLCHYATDNKIAGISLYTHRTNVNCHRPFEPLHDGSDVFFLQFASSWGQAWTVEQWRGFRTWYNLTPHSVTTKDYLPANVISWPESSWLKYFIKYMASNDLYFVYPRNSLTTNFSDPGTHCSYSSNLYQVPLQVKSPLKKWRFSSLKESISVYDAFFEIIPSSLSHVFDHQDITSTTIDLYGTKPLKHIRTTYILTCRPYTGDPIISFGCSLTPRDANVFFKYPGEQFNLIKSNDVNEMSCRPEWEINYDIKLLPDNMLYRYVFDKFIDRIKRKLLA